MLPEAACDSSDDTPHSVSHTHCFPALHRLPALGPHPTNIDTQCCWREVGQLMGNCQTETKGPRVHTQAEQAERIRTLGQNKGVFSLLC